MTSRTYPADDPVIAEYRRFPHAQWVERTRTLSPTPYGWMKKRVTRGLRFGVAARIEDPQGRVLLVRLNPGSGWTRNWITPGGGGEPREGPSDAIRREIREETGVRVRSLRLWKVYHETLRTQGEGGLAWDFLQYTALWAGGSPRSRVPTEVTEVRWFLRLPTNMEFREDWLRPPKDRFAGGLPK